MKLPLLLDATWPIPDWQQVEPNEPESNPGEFWTSVGSEWMTLLAEFLGDPYQITESPRFWLIAPYPSRQAINQIKWLEEALNKIGKFLGPLGRKSLTGKCPVLIFGNDEDYYNYIANYYNEGEWATSGGCLY